MKAHQQPTKLSSFWIFLALTAGAIGAAVLIANAAQETQAANEGSAAATYSHGILHATIPYRAPHAGAGQLTVEVLNPEDEVLGRSEQRLDLGAGAGTWQEDVKLAKDLATDDLVWHRLRYGFTYDRENGTAIGATESILQILRMPVVHIRGQQSYLTGGRAGG